MTEGARKEFGACGDVASHGFTWSKIKIPQQSSRTGGEVKGEGGARGAGSESRKGGGGWRRERRRAGGACYLVEDAEGEDRQRGEADVVERDEDFVVERLERKTSRRCTRTGATALVYTTSVRIWGRIGNYEKMPVLTTDIN